MTFDELRAKATEAFKDPTERKFWMNQVNEMLTKNPTLLKQWQALKTPSPESVRLQATKAPQPGVPEQQQLRQGAQDIQASPLATPQTIKSNALTK